MNWESITADDIKSCELGLRRAQTKLDGLAEVVPPDLADGVASTRERVNRALNDPNLSVIKQGLEGNDPDAAELGRLWAGWAEQEIGLVEALRRSLKQGLAELIRGEKSEEFQSCRRR
jgi:hypothetical protein